MIKHDVYQLSVKVCVSINEIVSIKTKNKSSPVCIEKNDDLITDLTLICTEFNNYFTNIADKILQAEKSPILKSFDKFLNTPLQNSFVFELCDPAEICLLIN